MVILGSRQVAETKISLVDRSHTPLELIEMVGLRISDSLGNAFVYYAVFHNRLHNHFTNSCLYIFDVWPSTAYCYRSKISVSNPLYSPPNIRSTPCPNHPLAQWMLNITTVNYMIEDERLNTSKYHRNSKLLLTTMISKPHLFTSRSHVKIYTNTNFWNDVQTVM